MRLTVFSVSEVRDVYRHPQPELFHFEALQAAPRWRLGRLAAVQFSFNGEVGLNTAYIGLWI